jgi:hypothetical protein
MHDSGALRRGSVEVCLHVIARSERDEAIHLSRGWHGLLRFARNDGVRFRIQLSNCERMRLALSASLRAKRSNPFLGLLKHRLLRRLRSSQ